MSPWLATLIVGAVSLVGNLLATAYFYGRLSQRVDNHDKEFSGIQQNQRDQWSKINQTAEGLSKIKGALGVNGSV